MNGSIWFMLHEVLEFSDSFDILEEYPFFQEFLNDKIGNETLVENVEAFEEDLIKKGLTPLEIKVLKRVINDQDREKILKSLDNKIYEDTDYYIRRRQDSYGLHEAIRILSEYENCIIVLENLFGEELKWVKSAEIRIAVIQALAKLKSKNSIPLIMLRATILRNDFKFYDETDYDKIIESSAEIITILAFAQDLKLNRLEQYAKNVLIKYTSLISNALRYWKEEEIKAGNLSSDLLHYRFFIYILLNHPDPSVRVVTMRFLAEIDVNYKSCHSFKKIALMLEDEDERIGVWARVNLFRLLKFTDIWSIKELLYSKNSFVRCTGIELLALTRAKMSIPWIRPLLKDPDENVRKIAAVAIAVISKDIKDNRLYSGVADEKFFDANRQMVRKEFAKTGSRTILLGGQHLNKVIIRIVSEPAFLAWKKALEAQVAWVNAGFDYIPVEPILKKGGKIHAYRTKEGNYRVYTQVLGPSYYIFRLGQVNTVLLEQLNDVQKIIESVLKNLNIVHGHLHDNNFCVNDHEGKLRLYVIDFDQAISPPPNP